MMSLFMDVALGNFLTRAIHEVYTGGKVAVRWLYIVYIGMFMSPHMEAGLALVRAVDSPPTVRSQPPPPDLAIAQPTLK